MRKWWDVLLCSKWNTLKSILKFDGNWIFEKGWLMKVWLLTQETLTDISEDGHSHFWSNLCITCYFSQRRPYLHIHSVLNGLSVTLPMWQWQLLLSGSALSSISVCIFCAQTFSRSRPLESSWIYVMSNVNTHIAELHQRQRWRHSVNTSKQMKGRRGCAGSWTLAGLGWAGGCEVAQSSSASTCPDKNPSRAPHGSHPIHPPHPCPDSLCSVFPLLPACSLPEAPPAPPPKKKPVG